jgi:predicted nucleic acid-binding protein
VDSKKVFLDTNIVLDILDNSRTDSDSIKAFLKKLIVDRYTVVISEDMVPTRYLFGFFY